MDENAIRIGENLKRLRLAAGLTQSEVARAVGVTYQQVQKYETGGNRLTADKIHLLKTLYNVSYDVFFRGLVTDHALVGKGSNKSVRLFDQLMELHDQKLRRKIERVLLIFLEE